MLFSAAGRLWWITSGKFNDEGTGMMQLKLLWELQKLDVAIAALKQSLADAPGQSGVEPAEKSVEELTLLVFEREEGLRAENKAIRELEMKVQKLSTDQRDLRDNLYSGKVGSAKELEQMQKRLETLKSEQEDAEDGIIALMESTEEGEGFLAAHRQALEEAQLHLAQEKQALAGELARLEEELNKLQQERVLLAAGIEDVYLERYDHLCGKLGDHPLAAISGDTCGECRVFVSAGLRGQLYNPGAMVYCENCGRLLVDLQKQS